MSDTVEKIKERLSIVDVVGGYVKLVRAGKYWKGLSPFTKERTPSFFVTPDKGLYHCFSTGKGGDMFTFVEEMESVDFKGALKILAERAGVEIVREAPGARDERADLYAALAAAAEFYQSVRAKRSDVDAYLVGRGINVGLLSAWRVGYAPREWHALKEALTAQGFSEHTLEKAGLIKREGIKVYDRFRGRIMFPIFDVSGRVIAFSGRIFEDDPTHPQAKYINSPEGPLFDKSRALYGIHEAKSGIRTLGFSMLVEGQVDLLLAHQLGYKNAVATSGTALTASHAELLKRYSTNILLSYDGDQAGVRATHRAAELLLPLALNVKVVALPLGVDPADQIHRDPQSFKDRVKHAEPVIDFFMAHVKATAKDERTRNLEVGTVVLPLVARIENKLDQAHSVARIASELGVDSSAVAAELTKQKTAAPAALTAPGKDPFFAEDQRERLLYGIIRTFEDMQDAQAAEVERIFTDSYGVDRLRVLRSLGESDDETAKMVASENFFTLYTTPEAAHTCIAELREEAARRDTSVRDAYNALRRSLADAEKRGEEAAVHRIMEELAALSKKLN